MNPPGRRPQGAPAGGPQYRPPQRPASVASGRVLPSSQLPSSQIPSSQPPPQHHQQPQHQQHQTQPYAPQPYNTSPSPMLPHRQASPMQEQSWDESQPPPSSQPRTYYAPSQQFRQVAPPMSPAMTPAPMSAASRPDSYRSVPGTQLSRLPSQPPPASKSSAADRITQQVNQLESRIGAMHDETRTLRDMVHEVRTAMQALPTREEMKEEVREIVSPAVYELLTSLRGALQDGVAPLPEVTAQLVVEKVRALGLGVPAPPVPDNSTTDTLITHLIKSLAPIDELRFALRDLDGLPEAIRDVAVFKSSMDMLNAKFDQVKESQKSVADAVAAVDARVPPPRKENNDLRILERMEKRFDAVDQINTRVIALEQRLAAAPSQHEIMSTIGRLSHDFALFRSNSSPSPNSGPPGVQFHPGHHPLMVRQASGSQNSFNFQPQGLHPQGLTPVTPMWRDDRGNVMPSFPPAFGLSAPSPSPALPQQRQPQHRPFRQLPETPPVEEDWFARTNSSNATETLYAHDTLNPSGSSTVRDGTAADTSTVLATSGSSTVREGANADTSTVLATPAPSTDQSKPKPKRVVNSRKKRTNTTAPPQGASATADTNTNNMSASAELQATAEHTDVPGDTVPAPPTKRRKRKAVETDANDPAPVRPRRAAKRKSATSNESTPTTASTSSAPAATKVAKQAKGPTVKKTARGVKLPPREIPQPEPQPEDDIRPEPKPRVKGEVSPREIEALFEGLDSLTSLASSRPERGKTRSATRRNLEVAGQTDPVPGPSAPALSGLRESDPVVVDSLESIEVIDDGQAGYIAHNLPVNDNGEIDTMDGDALIGLF